MRLFITVLYISLANLALAQDSENNDYYFGENFTFSTIGTDPRMMVRQEQIYQVSDKNIWSVYEYFDNNRSVPGKSLNIEPKSPILLGIKLGPKLKNYFSADVPNFSKQYSSYLVPDSSEATIVAMGIQQDNIHHFQYRVVENDSIELVKWSPLPGLDMKYGAKVPYGKIGTFRYPGKKILIEVAHREIYGIRDGYIIDWRQQNKPTVSQIIARGYSAYGYYNLAEKSQNKGYAKTFDKESNLPLDWKFPLDSISDFTLNFDKHETRPYSIYLLRDLENKRDTIRLEWWLLADRFTLENTYINQIGNYSLIVQQTGRFGKFDEDELTRIDFSVFKPSEPIVQRLFTLQQLLPYLLAFLMFVSLIILVLRWQAKRKLKLANQQQQQITMQLQRIRGQLNPHFMFNAINSIQNLMQKGDMDSANNYLSTFAALTRDVLETSEKEMYSLREEMKLIDEYLQMEQLRFGFQYLIRNELKINPDLIEIPSLLIQPLVENAVKHGVSKYLENGVIEIVISQKNNDLHIAVTDNGGGIMLDQLKESKGFGLRLSKKRLALLNAMYTANNFELTFEKNPNGTVARISIKNWLQD